jgi:hypothetical protein
MAFSRSSLESTQQENKRLQVEVGRLRLHLAAANARVSDVEHHEHLLREHKTVLSQLLDALHLALSQSADARKRVEHLRREVVHRQRRLKDLQEETRLTEFYIQQNGTRDRRHHQCEETAAEDSFECPKSTTNGLDDAQIESDCDEAEASMRRSAEALEAATRDVRAEDAAIEERIGILLARR